MKHIITAFGRRPLSADQIIAQRQAMRPASVPACDKWQVFRELCTARAAFGLKDRDLAVLDALISFLPGRDLTEADGTIVFPSNATLAARTHGMAESTLRRHLARLTDASVILRHDSPNGKRYAARHSDGSLARAYGFDLRRLLTRRDEISRAARAAEDALARRKALRETFVLRLRNATKLIAYARDNDLPGDWTKCQRHLDDLRPNLRRKLGLDQLQNALDNITDLLGNISDLIDSALAMTPETGANDIQNERHHSSSNTEHIDFEEHREQGDPCLVPLALVLDACPDIRPYAPNTIRHWHDLIALAHDLRPMLGLSETAWQKARAVLGEQGAAIVISCLTQRADNIRNLGAYLQRLVAKATAGRFSPGPMVLAQLHQQTIPSRS